MKDNQSKAGWSLTGEMTVNTPGYSLTNDMLYNLLVHNPM